MGLRNILKSLAAAIIFACFFTSPLRAGDWVRADTHHFTIYSDGSPGQLEDFAHELEKFDALLRSLWNIKVKNQPQKLTIYMVSTADDVQDLHGGNNVAGYYSANTDGSYAVSNRRQTSKRERLSGQEVLFHEYAHHFMFHNFAIPAPPWFVEGYAEFVATAQFKKNGQWIFGLPAFHRAAEVKYIDAPSIEELLTFGSEDGPERMRGNFYGWSWALTHMLYIEKGDGGASIVRYLNAINRGQDSLAAARSAFGDLDQLERDLRRYVEGRMTAKKSPRPIAYLDQVAITELKPFESALVELTMQRRANFELDETRDRLAELTSAASATAEAWYQLARAEKALAFRAAGEEGREADATSEGEKAEEIDPDFSATRAALTRALALDPDHPHASVEMARLLMDWPEASDETDGQRWNTARDHLLRANHADPLDPYALFYLAENQTRRGISDEQVSAALQTAFERAPEASQVRIAYAFDLANQGQYRPAIKLLEVLANHPHYRSVGRPALEHVLAMQNGGIPVISMDSAAVE